MNPVLSIFFLLFPLQIFAQTKSIDQKIKDADSIILIIHKISREYEVNEEGKNKNAPNFLTKNDINPEIILSKNILLDRQRLIDILHVDDGKYKHTPFTCDQPRNSILIYKKAKLSYIDICFQCQRIHTSDDLEEFVVFDNERFKKLEAFFKSFKLLTED